MPSVGVWQVSLADSPATLHRLHLQGPFIASILVFLLCLPTLVLVALGTALMPLAAGDPAQLPGAGSGP